MPVVIAVREGLRGPLPVVCLSWPGSACPTRPSSSGRTRLRRQERRSCFRDHVNGFDAAQRSHNFSSPQHPRFACSVPQKTEVTCHLAAVNVGGRCHGDGMTSTACVGLSSRTAVILRDLEREFAELRRVQSTIIRITADFSECSRRELGRSGLSAVGADTGPAATLALIGRITTSEAVRFVSVARATAPTTTITREPLAPRFPHLAAATSDDAIALHAAAIIVSNLDQVGSRHRASR